MDGSLRRLWSVSLPLMLSFMSGMAMIFVDRLFLAHYSQTALDAAVSAGTIAWGFSVGFSQLTGIGAVFVAQLNGAGSYRKMGQPIWQMLWLCLFLLPIFAIAGIYGAPRFFVGSQIEADQVLYFRSMMAICPLFCVNTALAGYFVGRGRTGVITVLTLVGNGLNILLDPILIFGWGVIPAFGIVGACVATGLSLALQIVALSALFLQSSQRENCGTGHWQLNPSLLSACLRVGAPESLALGLEIAAWGIYYTLLVNASIVISICQTILLLFMWFGIGLQNGVVSMGGNLIGAGRKADVPGVLWSALKLTSLFAVATGVLFYLSGAWLIDLFLENPEADAEVHALAMQGLVFIWGYLVLDSIRMTVHGVLRAAGDTLYIFVMGSLSIWFLLLGPTYILLVILQKPLWVAFAILLAYIALTLMMSSIRFWWGTWKSKRLISAHT